MDLRKLSRVQDSGNKTKFTEEERKKLAEEGLALPDGSFPIRNKQDLKDAIKAIGLARSYDKTKKWIIKRARELNAIDELPESWKVKDDNISDSKDYKDVNLMDYDGDIEIGMRVYEKLASGNKAHGKVTGVNYHAGTVNIEGEEYDDSYDVPWEEVFVA